MSLCVIAKNEENNIGACLESAADVVNDVIVVDTGSTDRTKEIALAHGAKVFDFPWVDSFAAARNEALRHATGQWIFWMDADDRLDAANRAKLRSLFAELNGENVAFSMKCLCLPDPVSKTATAVDHVRLFRNDPRIRWRYRVHEQILPAIRETGGHVRWSEVIVQHTGYQDLSLRARKLERDLRLLQLENAEHPDDPFTLFNLGSVSLELGQIAEAVPLLQRSLERSHPGDSIVRKLYALLSQCHRQLGQRNEALAACRAGRALYPDDVELLFQEGLVYRENDNRPGAEACWLRLLERRDGAHFASVDLGLLGYKTRHNLAILYQQDGRMAEAEAQWQAAVVENPDFFPARIGLSELAITRARWAELEQSCVMLEADMPVETAVLRARGMMARKEFGPARNLIQETIEQHPEALWPRVILSHVLLQEGKDWPAAETALRNVLRLDPHHAEAQKNLTVLLRQRTFEVSGHAAGQPDLAALYASACAVPSDINEHCRTLYALAKECRHVTEMGTRTGVSTTALLYAQPHKLVCYDLQRFPQIDELTRLSGKTEFVFHQADVHQIEIEPTDMLFIDTWHVYEQLRNELRQHAAKVRKYIVLHDTTTFGDQGESLGHRGLWPAVEEFLALGSFRVQRRYANNNGLTVLERVTP